MADLRIRHRNNNYRLHFMEDPNIMVSSEIIDRDFDAANDHEPTADTLDHLIQDGRTLTHRPAF